MIRNSCTASTDGLTVKRVVVGVHDVDTVEREIVIRIALAGYGESDIASRRSPLTLRASGLRFAYSGNQQSQLQKVAAVQWHRRDLLVLDHAATAGRGRVHQRRGAFHSDLLLNVAHLHRDVDPRDLSNSKDHSAQQCFLESCEGNGDVVSADRQTRHAVVAV